MISDAAERVAEHAREAARLLEVEPVDLRAVEIELVATETELHGLRGAAMIRAVERHLSGDDRHEL